jgi:catechol 2,3-dioxygenase-like lactoylglutathione lyase family enzyme
LIGHVARVERSETRGRPRRTIPDFASLNPGYEFEEAAMTITLNHAIVPARDKVAAAKFFARLFGLKRGRSGYFAPVRVNKTLTLLFDDDSKFESHHYAFHVSKAEFDAILGRIKKAKIAFGSAPWSLDDGKLNDWNGGRGVYFRDPNGHVLELMTVPQ